MKLNLPIHTRAERRSPTRPDSMSAFGNAPDREIGAPAFSLIEILVVIALLSFIVFGLLAMFTQTQRAFRTGLTQSDVLESGRLITDMIVREIEQTSPANQPGMNFFANMPYNNAVYSRPFLQALPGNPASLRRTNLLHDIFFVAQRNQDLVGIGYFVRVNYPTNDALRFAPFGAGTLYRFEMQTNAMIYSSYGGTVARMHEAFDLAKFNQSRVTKVADGVVHFLARAFDTNGYRIVVNQGSLNQDTNIFAYFDRFDGRANLIAGEIEVYEFWSNAVPAALELELGILEDRAWQQFKAQPTVTAQSNFLFNAAGRVHVFRQRIPIRNVDPVAYQ